jgi:hypothetical protein
MACLTGVKFNKVRQACNEDRSNMINNVGNSLGLSCITWHYILIDDWSIRLTSANFVPRLLNNDLQKPNFMCAKP